LPANTVVCSLEGPFFFGAAERLENTLEEIHHHAEILVLRMAKVPFIDATGMQTLWDLWDTCKRHKTRLVLCGMRPNVVEKLKRAGLAGQIGEMNMLTHIRQLMAEAEA
jgi:SulP family sulfate permease